MRLLNSVGHVPRYGMRFDCFMIWFYLLVL